MKTVYEASNAVEAHMLQDLLRQDGITAEVTGQYLQGAIGELPAAGLVRLMVDEAHYDRARDALARWEKTSFAAPDAGHVANAEQRRIGRLTACAIGVLLGAGIAALAVYTPAHDEGFDHNRDGKLDERWLISTTGRVIGYEADRNLDGRVDYRTKQDAQGRADTGESDDDFDGRFETQLSFRDGQLESSESDTDGDGVVDVRLTYERGVFTRAAFIDKHSGHVYRVEHVKLGYITHVEMDTDGDGKLDQRVTYSRQHEVTSRAALPTGAR